MNNMPVRVRLRVPNLICSAMYDSRTSGSGSQEDENAQNRQTFFFLIGAAMSTYVLDNIMAELLTAVAEMSCTKKKQPPKSL